MNTYTTVSGDTFDKIALEQLGSEYLFPLLLAENQQYRDVLIFSDGIVLNIPDVSTNDVLDDVPEWLADDFESAVEYTDEELAQIEEDLVLSQDDGTITTGDESDS